MQDPNDALQEGQRILARRFRRSRMAAGALLTLGLGGVAVAGAILGARYGVFVFVVPLALAPKLARAAIARLQAEGPQLGERNLGERSGLSQLRDRLRLRVAADRIEGPSLILPMVAAGAIAPIIYGGILSTLVGLSLGGVGKGLLAIAHLVGAASLALGFGMYGEARRLLAPGESWWARANPGRPPLLAAAVITTLLMLFPLSTDLVVEVAFAGGLFALGSGATTIIPSLWWMRRRLRKERAVLTRIALPALTESGPEVRAWLEAATVAPEAPAPMRAEALAELVRRFPIAETRSTLERALYDQAPAMITAALGLCLQHRHRPPLERVLELGQMSLHPPANGALHYYGEAVEPGSAVAICRLLRRFQDPRIEPLLLAFLGEPTLEVASTAAESLGLVGSIDAVEPLRKAAARGPVRVMATEAIERIQIRHHRGQGGALSLADGAEAGEVSLVEGGEGAVSVIDR